MRTLATCHALLSFLLALALPAQTPTSAADNRGLAPNAPQSPIGRDALAAAGVLLGDRITFVANAGQWPAETLFVARRREMLAVVERDRLRVHLGTVDDASAGASFALAFAGGAPVAVEALEPVPESYNFFCGSDAAGWRTAVRGCAQVVHRGVHAGVDVLWREHAGRLEYDVLVAAGADLAALVIRAEGVLGLQLGADGGLVMRTANGPVRQTAPVAWEETADGRRIPLPCHFRLIDERHYGFLVEGRHPERRLVVDPGLLWSTYVGGGANDVLRAVEHVASGDVIVAGQTQSLLPPTASFGAGGGWDAFVARFRPAAAGGGAAQLLWVTRLGGAAVDCCFDIDSAPNGDLHLIGFTSSSGALTGFPVTAGAFQPTLGGATDAFLAVLDSATGSTLRASTYFGFVAHEFGHSIIAFGDGSVRFAGTTNSPGLPTTPGAFQPTLAGGRDAFVGHFDPAQTGAAQLVYLTYLGGSGDEGTIPTGLVYNESFKEVIFPSYSLASSATITVAGVTLSLDFPTMNPFQAVRSTTWDGFVARLDTTQVGAQQLVWSTYVGGTGIETVTGLAVDAAGCATIVGSTTSAQFPITAASAFQPVHASAASGLADGFVTRFDPELAGSAQLVYSTFLGGSGTDRIACIETADEAPAFGDMDVFLAGYTDSVVAQPYFPTSRGALFSLATNSPFNVPVTLAWIARLDLGQPVPGNQLLYSTLFGAPTGGQMAYAVAIDPDHGAVVTGATLSAGIPTTPGTWQPAYAGGSDGWVAWLDLLPTGAIRHGTPTPGPSGRPVIGVRSQPHLGNSQFAFTCSGAPPAAFGVFGVSLAVLIPAVQYCNTSVWISLNNDLIFAALVAADQGGYSEWVVAIPPNPTLTGLNLASQYLWFEPAGGCSGSAALIATLQQ